MRYGMPPIHEGDTHCTLKTSYAYEPTLSLCHRPQCSEGGSNQRDGSNGMVSYINDGGRFRNVC